MTLVRLLLNTLLARAHAPSPLAAYSCTVRHLQRNAGPFDSLVITETDEAACVVETARSTQRQMAEKSGLAERGVKREREGKSEE